MQQRIEISHLEVQSPTLFGASLSFRSIWHLFCVEQK